MCAGQSNQVITCQRRHQLSTTILPNFCTIDKCACRETGYIDDRAKCFRAETTRHEQDSRTLLGLPQINAFFNGPKIYFHYLTDVDKTKPKFRRKTMSLSYGLICFLTCFSILISIVHASDRDGNPPHVVASDVTTLAAFKGQTITISCMVSGNPLPHTAWSKDGEPIGRDWKRFKHQRLSLRIRNVEMSDSGLYHCEAVNGYGSRQVEIRLQVHDSSQTETQTRKKETAKPIFSQPTKMRRRNTVKPQGSTVIFRCKATGRPRPRIQWFKDGNLTGQRDGQSSSKPQWSLTIRNIELRDSGRYTCRVWNLAGEITYDYNLEVVGTQHERPVLLKPHPVNTTVRVGETASIQCRVRSDVTPTIKWIKRLDNANIQYFNGKWPNNSLQIDKKLYLILPAQAMMRFPDGSYLNKLVIKQATTRDSGMYICLGANTMGYSYRYAYLTVTPSSDSQLNTHYGRTLPRNDGDQGSLPLPVIIGVPAGVGLILVCIVSAYCLCKRDQMNRFPDRVGRATRVGLQTRTTRNPVLIGASAPLRSASTSRDDDDNRSSCEQGPCIIQVSNRGKLGKYNDLPAPDAESELSSINEYGGETLFCDKLFPDPSDSELASSCIRPPPPPPPSQYSRSSSTDAGRKMRHSCHRSGRHHHHHHSQRHRVTIDSASSHPYCSHQYE